MLTLQHQKKNPPIIIEKLFLFSKNSIKKINEIKKIIERFSFLNTKVDSVYQPETIKIQQHKMEFILSHLSFQ